jgi:hypothetical protein
MLPNAAFATGVFGSIEAGYHRIVPVDDLFATVLDGRKGSPVLGLGAGYEFQHGVFVAAQAGYLKFEPQKGFYAPGMYRGEEPSRIRYVPLVVSLGLRSSIGKRVGITVSAGGGVAQQRQESEVDPRGWNRTSWHPTWRLTVRGDHGAGAIRIGARIAWIFLPQVAIQQMPEPVDFGGVSVAATLCFGRRPPSRP